MKQGTSQSLIEKSSIDFLDPYISQVKAQTQQIVINQPVVARFSDFDSSEIF